MPSGGDGGRSTYPLILSLLEKLFRCKGHPEEYEIKQVFKEGNVEGAALKKLFVFNKLKLTCS